PHQRRRSFHVRRGQYARLGSAARLARRLFSGDGGGEKSGGGTAPVIAAYVLVSRARRLARAGKMPQSARGIVLAPAPLAAASRDKLGGGGRGPGAGGGGGQGGRGRLDHDLDSESGRPSAQTRVREGLPGHRAEIDARGRNPDRRENSRGRRGWPRPGRRL